MLGYIYCVPSACITNSSFEYYNEIQVLFGSVGERRILNSINETKQVTHFFHYSEMFW